jgi:hypothetical protein
MGLRWRRPIFSAVAKALVLDRREHLPGLWKQRQDLDAGEVGGKTGRKSLRSPELQGYMRPVSGRLQAVGRRSRLQMVLKDVFQFVCGERTTAELQLGGRDIDIGMGGVGRSGSWTGGGVVK